MTLLRELLRTWAKVLQKSDRGSIEPPNWIPGRTSIEAGPTSIEAGDMLKMLQKCGILKSAQLL